MQLKTAFSHSLLQPARFEGEIGCKPVRLCTLCNASGMRVAVTNYGAKIEQIIVPDRHGHFDDVVLGYDSLEGVVNGAFAVGAFVGRYAGRIGNARFTLNGVEHRLSANDSSHCLHGGAKGSFCRVFDAVQVDASSVEMHYVFADGEEGFPGTLALRLTYRVGESNELCIDYETVALDRPTVASFTTHAFFNLNGAASGSALNHEVMIAADRYFVMTPELIATGELLPVDNTPFDLRQPTLLSSRVRGLSTAFTQPLRDSAQEPPLDGYDDCFLVKRAGTGVGAGVEMGAGRWALGPVRTCACAANRTGDGSVVHRTRPAVLFRFAAPRSAARPARQGRPDLFSADGVVF